MEEYLAEFGRHFNKKLFEFAVGLMEDRSGNKLQAWNKEQADDFLKSYGVTVYNGHGHDSAYVVNMARADYWASSITDEQHLALYVHDYLDDEDGNPTRAFDEFYINCVAKGIPIFWEEML
jgi:hypothetical protein